MTLKRLLFSARFSARIHFLAFLLTTLLSTTETHHSSLHVDVLLYATNAISTNECTLHVLDPDSGIVKADIGLVQTIDGQTMGIFGMCHHYQNDVNTGRMYGINDFDELVTIDLDTAIATVVGPVGVNGLYDLACRDGVAYSYSAKDSFLATISLSDGKGSLLKTKLDQSDAVSMDFDDQGVLWLLQNGKVLSHLDTTTGAQGNVTVISGVNVDQRHGSYLPGSGLLYSAFFEPDPSNIWLVDLDHARVANVYRSSLSNAYTLAFVQKPRANEANQMLYS